MKNSIINMVRTVLGRVCVVVSVALFLFPSAVLYSYPVTLSGTPAALPAAPAIMLQGDIDETISLALSRLPAQTAEDYNAVMAELAGTGEDGIRALAARLVPAGTGENATVEYALNGVASYVSEEGRASLAASVRSGLRIAIGECTDKPNQAFLLSLLQICGTSGDADFLAGYLDDEYAGIPALNALISIPGTDDAILSLVKKNGRPSASLAYAAACKGIAKAEKPLLKWSSSATTDVELENIYYALARCGSKKSISTLSAAAASVGYGLGGTDATSSYLFLLNRLAGQGDTAALNEAKSLLDSDYTHIRIAALDILLGSDSAGIDGKALVLAALGDDDRQYRRSALTEASFFADEAFYAEVVSCMPSLSTQAKADVVSWLGDCKVESRIDAVTGAMREKDNELACTAIRAAGKIGGNTALEALMGELAGPHAVEAFSALAAFNGDIRDAVAASLDSDDPAGRVHVINLAGLRHVHDVSSRIMTLTGDENPAVSHAAYAALAGVCTADDFDSLCGLLEICDPQVVLPVQDAAIKSLARESAATRYSKSSSAMSSSSCPERYYPLIAASGSPDAVVPLLEAARGGSSEAFASLLGISDPRLVEALPSLASQNADWRDAALSRSCDLAEEYLTPSDRPAYFRSSLAQEPSVKVTNKILTAVGNSYSPDGIAVALEYIGNEDNASAAAYAIKSIAAGSATIDATMRDALLLAKAVFTELSATSADAGYAVDEINGMLTK